MLREQGVPADTEIARADWPRFLDEFSRAHEGWLVTVEERSPEESRELVREVPLSGLTVEFAAGRPREITILTGPRESEWAHRIVSPAKVRLHRTPEGAEEGIETESENGLRTVIRFRSAAFPEAVDGILPEI